MRTQFLPPAAKITPDRIAFPCGHGRICGEKPMRKELFLVKHQENLDRTDVPNRALAAIYPFACWVVAFFQLQEQLCFPAVHKESF